MKKKNNNIKYSFDNPLCDYGYLKLASIGKRAFAGFCDFILFVFLFTCLFLASRELFIRSTKAEEITYKQEKFLENSGLFSKVNGKLTFFESDNYIAYQNIIYNFYLDNLDNIDNKLIIKDSEFSDIKLVNEEDSIIYWFNVFILGQDDLLNRYININILDNRYKTVNEFGKNIFSSNKHNIANEFASLKEGVSKSRALEYFFVKNKTCIYTIALNDLYSIDAYQDLRDEYSKYYSSFPIYIAFPISLVLVYVLPCFIFANGETFSKKALYLCLVKSNGHQYKRYLICFRTLLPFLLLFLIYIFYPFVALILALLLIFISFIFMIFDKKHRSILDFFGMSMVIDAKISLWFKDDSEQETYALKRKSDT